MTTIASALALHHRLQDSDSARLDCELLLGDVLKKDRTYLYTWPEKELTAEQVEAYHMRLLRREKGEPVAHILGEKEFWSLSLLVNASTLIPRPETELLVEVVLELQIGLNEPGITLADLGAGTGAIGLALAKERATWEIVGLEKQKEALALAEKNRQRLGLQNIRFYSSDWFTAVVGRRFHVIVSNPPYIDTDNHYLNQGDVRFEPASALIAADHGYADLALIIEQAPGYLESNGWLLLEHGNQQGDKVRALFLEAGFSHIQTKTDLAGHPRVTLGQLLV